MKRNILKLAALSIGAFFAVNAFAADDLAARAQQTIADFQSANPSLRTFMNNSAGYAVFPSVGKGGLVFGGARGQGLLFENGAITGRTRLTQASFGAQVGGQTFSQIIVFENPAAVSNFKSGRLQLGAGASAVAVSKSAQAGVPLTYSQGLAVFTMQQSGLMVAATVGGQKFSFEPVTASQPIAPTGR